jgi:predicted nucleic acid-binding Zn ribbon protein
MEGRKRKCKTPVPLGDVLSAVLRSAGLETAYKTHSVLLQWKEIAGEGIAKHAEAKEIKDGVLFLKVENAVWRSQLFALRGDLLQKINAYAGKKIVSKIHYL